RIECLGDALDPCGQALGPLVAPRVAMHTALAERAEVLVRVVALDVVPALAQVVHHRPDAVAADENVDQWQRRARADAGVERPEDLKLLYVDLQRMARWP